MTIIVKKPEILHNEYHPEKEEKPVVEPTTKTSEDVHGGDEITQSIEDVRFSQQNNTQYTQQQDNNGQQSEMNGNIPQSTLAYNNTYDKQGLQQTNEESIQQPSSNDQQNNEDNGQHQSTSQQQSTNQQNNVDESTQQNDEQQDNNGQQSEMNGDVQQNQNNDIQPNDTVSQQQTTSNDNDTQQNNNIPQSNEYNTQNSTTCNSKSTQQSSTDINQQNEDDNQNDTEQQQEDDNQLDDSTSDESEGYDNDYEDDEYYDYEEDDEQEDTSEYNTQQAFEINKNAIKRQLFLTFYRLVEYLSDEEKQPTLLPGQSLVLNVKRLMMRQYERKPINTYYYYRTRSQVVLILDNSGSMTWLIDELDTFFAAALKRKDVQIYIAPNGHIESYYNNKTKRFEYIDHDEATQQIIRSGLPVIYIGDFDGANTPIELSWTNKVYWICPETRYKYFSRHNWVGRCLKEDEYGNCIKFQPYYEDDFKGFFGRTFDDKEMIEVLRQFARNIQKQRFWYDKHDISDFKEEY